MKSIENNPESPRRVLTRRQKVAATAALVGASLGAGLMLADRGSDSSDHKSETTSTDVSQPDSTAPEASISETPQSMQPTPAPTEASISENPTVMTPEPLETPASQNG